MSSKRTQETWTLQPRFAARADAGPLYWNSDRAEYTSDLTAAKTFTSRDEADRWLRTHAYLKAVLRPVDITPKGSA